MPFTFSFRGRFDNLTQFFSRMERFVTLRNEQMNVTGRLLRLESIDLRVDRTGSRTSARRSAPTPTWCPRRRA